MKSVTITLGNAVSRIDCERSTLHRLDSQLAVEDPGAMWARQRNPSWDGFWHFVDVIRGTFPTGLRERVLEILPLASVIDERERPPTIKFNPKILDGITLADHQCESVQKFLEVGNGVIGTSVGSGKTEAGIAIACHVHGQCVWITHRKDLLRQTAERILLRTGETAGLIGDGCWDENTDGKKFLIVMPQTAVTDLQTYAEQVKNASVLISDEVHTSSSAVSWFKISQLVPAYYRCGLTGSPSIGDPVRERRLEAATGKVLIHIRSGEMAERGWITPAEVRYHKVYNTTLHGVDYATARRLLIEENPQRNAMIVELALEEAQSGRKTLIICDTIRHAKIISTILNGEHIRSRMLCGYHSSSVRSAAKRDFKSGVTEIVISTPVWDLGVDIPSLEVVILAAGGKSAVRVIQRAGRALRKFPGKKKATIHDFFDTGSMYTVRHSRMRMATCKTEGFEVVVPDAPSSTPTPIP